MVNFAGCYQNSRRPRFLATSLSNVPIFLAKLRHTRAHRSKNPPGMESATAVSSHSIRLQYHSRGPSTTSFLLPWSVSISRPLRTHRIATVYRPPPSSLAFFIGRAPSLFDSWTLTARQFFLTVILKSLPVERFLIHSIFQSFGRLQRKRFV